MILLFLLAACGGPTKGPGDGCYVHAYGYEWSDPDCPCSGAVQAASSGQTLYCRPDQKMTVTPIDPAIPMTTLSQTLSDLDVHNLPVAIVTCECAP